jgi:hypothetical protein
MEPEICEKKKLKSQKPCLSPPSKRSCKASLRSWENSFQGKAFSDPVKIPQE